MNIPHNSNKINSKLIEKAIKSTDTYCTMLELPEVQTDYDAELMGKSMSEEISKYLSKQNIHPEIQTDCDIEVMDKYLSERDVGKTNPQSEVP